MSFDLAKASSMTERAAAKIVVDRAIGRALLKPSAGIPLTEFETLALKTAQATGFSPTRKSLHFAAIAVNHIIDADVEKAGAHSHTQQRHPSGRFRSSLFRRHNDTRHLTWTPGEQPRAVAETPAAVNLVNKIRRASSSRAGRPT